MDPIVSLKTRLSILLLCFVIGLVTAHIVLAAPQEFLFERDATLKTSAEVWGQEFCLGDLVEDVWLQSRCAVDRGQCCKFSLESKKEKRLSKNEIQNIVNKIALNGTRIVLKGADSVLVKQTHRALREDEITSKMAAQVSVKDLKINQPVFVALQSETDWDVVLPEKIAPYVNVKIIRSSNNNQVLGWVQAAIAQEEMVYTAKRTVNLQEPLSIEDFELRKADVLPLRMSGLNPISDKSFPTGSLAKQTVLKGAPLHTGHIQRIPAVKLGDYVTIVLRSELLRVSTKGIVQGAAAVGDMVTVQLPRYNRSFKGKLLEGKQVEVTL